LINKLLTFGYCHSPVQPEEPIPSKCLLIRKRCDMVERGFTFYCDTVSRKGREFECNC
jgi:pyridoxine/pyridoxamine 5'-phosphate oxidase